MSSLHRSTAPSPSSTATPSLPPLPPLTTHLAHTSTTKHAALRLIADSLAQRRQTAAAAIISSGPFLALATLLLGALVQYMYTDLFSLALIGTTAASVVMVLLILVRQACGGYLALAEKVGWGWLGEGEVLVMVWGEEVVGCVVFEEGKGEGEGKGRRGVVRAWTVRLRERGRGCGRGLLEGFCEVGRERGWEGVEVEDEDGGLYDQKVLIGMYHEVFERKMARARALLQEVWEDQMSKKRGDE